MMKQKGLRWLSGLLLSSAVTTVFLFFQNCSQTLSGTTATSPANLSTLEFNFSKPLLGKFDTKTLSALQLDYSTTVSFDHENQVLNVSSDQCGVINFQLGAAYYQALVDSIQAAQENNIYNSPYANGNRTTLPYQLRSLVFIFDSQDLTLQAVVDDGHLDQDSLQGPQAVLTHTQGLVAQASYIEDQVKSLMLQANSACSFSSLPTQPYGTTASANMVPTADAVTNDVAPMTSVPATAVLSFQVNIVQMPVPTPMPASSQNPTPNLPIGYGFAVYFNQAQQSVNFTLGSCAPVPGTPTDYQQLTTDLSSASLQPEATGSSELSITLLDGRSNNWGIDVSQVIFQDLMAIGARLAATYPQCIN
jgi:hypothetical protein